MGKRKRLEEAAEKKQIRKEGKGKKKDVVLFNKVVARKSEEGEGTDRKYYYVLTYLPDLQWCHLAPMYKSGVFGEKAKQSEGRPR
jgi:hypothetical protein